MLPYQPNLTKADMFTIDTIIILGLVVVAARIGISLKISFIRKR